MPSLDLVQIASDFADLAVVLPLVGGVLVLLLVAGERRAARWWLVTVGAALGVTLVLKLIFIPCGGVMPGLDVKSPSGHAASAAAGYGGLLVLLAQAGKFPGGRPAALILTGLFVFGIALTRVLLRAHTIEEAAIGAAIGLSAPILLAIPRGLFRAPAAFKWQWFLALPLVVVPVMLGVHAGTEDLIADLAFAAAHWLGVCGA